MFYKYWALVIMLQYLYIYIYIYRCIVCSGKNIHASLIFVSEAGAHLSGALLQSGCKYCNKRLRWRSLSMPNTLAYYNKAAMTTKKLFKIGYPGLCHKALKPLITSVS